MLVLSSGAAALPWSKKPNPERVSFFCAMKAAVFTLAERLKTADDNCGYVQNSTANRDLVCALNPSEHKDHHCRPPRRSPHEMHFRKR